MAENAVQVSFQFQCDAERVFLVCNAEGGAASVLEMSKAAAQEWQLRLKLAPGVYRFRYYAGDARQMTYYGPAKIADGVVDGMDTKLELLPPKQPLSVNPASSGWQSGAVRRCS